jgi:signal transduction histidine kinase/ligand-binding sensor domain-containing protein
MSGANRGGRYAAALGLLLACPCAFALDPALNISQYGHFEWRYRDGFAKGVIEDITQTPDGFLWLGTSFGLLRFDGVKMVPWQPPEGQHLDSNAISRLLAARDGTLWIGTRKGLASWKDDKLTQYGELAGLTVAALIEDQAGSVWVGALGIPDGKLCEIQSGTVQCHPEIGWLGQGGGGLHEDAKGNLWVGLEKGVWKWRPGPPQFYPVPGEPNEFQGMADGKDGALLVPTTGSVLRLANGKSEVAYSFPPDLRQSRGYRMLRDRDGGLWVATSGGGIVHISPGQAGQGRFDTFSQTDGLTADNVLALFEDREGSIWVATTNGLDRFRGLPVVNYSARQGLPAAPVGSVLAASDGSVWFPTSDGLNRLNHSQLTVYHGHHEPAISGAREVVAVGLPGQALGSLFEDSRGRIWISSTTGIGYLENDRYFSTAAPGGITTGIGGDAAGNIWIGYTVQGLVRLTPDNQIQRMPWETFGRKDPSRLLRVDPVEGGVWLGFVNGGLEYFRGGQVRATYSAKDGLAEGRVNDLRVGKDGALWVSTDGGISRLKDGDIVTRTSKQGLPCSAVLWMLEDDDQSVWLGTPCGLARIAKSDWAAWLADPKHGLNPTIFDSADGAGMAAIAGAYAPRVAKSLDGKVWFNTEFAVAVIDPGHLAFNKLPPPVHIEQIRADGNLYGPNQGVRLPPLVRDVRIDYTALSLAAPEKTHFRYKLEGQDPDWKEVVNEREAQYTNLPPRNYRFRVIASNNDGVWNEAGASFDFSIAPAYYQTTWFLLLSIGAFFALLWGMYRLRLRQMDRQFNIRAEERINERTRIARDLHDTLLQSFQGVLLKFHALSYKLQDRPETRSELEAVIEQARTAITEGRDAVQGLRRSTLITNDLANTISILGDGLVDEQSAGEAPRFSIQVEGTSRNLRPLVRDEVYRIAAEAMRNAFRHAKARQIEVEIHYDRRELRLRIRDDGSGFDPQIVADGGLAGHHGLPGMQERAKLAGGKLAIWSRLNSGTEIELTIPSGIAYAKSTASSHDSAQGSES